MPTPKSAKPKTPKAAKPVQPEAPALGAGEAEPEIVKAEVSKDYASIPATGKYEVVEVEAGKFRMFSPEGKHASPIVSREDKTEDGKPALAKLIRDCRRSNILMKNRQIATPKGHELK